ncbi:MAG: hypothetical protein LUQ57_04645 [Methylococcaceae bacterium]|nr:hypothetical protein [Methylococcaceae bacterium]
MWIPCQLLTDRGRTRVKSPPAKPEDFSFLVKGIEFRKLDQLTGPKEGKKYLAALVLILGGSRFMTTRRNLRLITKVILIGAMIAVLSYLFHPEVGQLSVTINGQPVADPLVRIAAIPTFLLIAGLAVILTIMLFLGIGMFIFLGALSVASLVCFMLAPYFWPVLAMIFLLIAVMSIKHER